MSQVEWNLGDAKRPVTAVIEDPTVKVVKGKKLKVITLSLTRDAQWDERDKARGFAVLKTKRQRKQQPTQ